MVIARVQPLGLGINSLEIRKMSAAVKISLKVRQRFESAAGAGGSFQPSINRIPGNLFGSGDCGFIHTFHAEGYHPINSSAAVLQSMVDRRGVSPKRLSAPFAQESASFSTSGLVETVADDAESLGGISGRA
jgi:hypothetical protein